MRIARSAAVGLVVVLVAASRADFAPAQSFRRGGTEFNAVRSVTVPAGKPYTVVVTEFFHQGEIRPDGRNVLVVAHNKELVPARILQLGPGDVCRLAFQTVAGQSEYDIFYGGDPPTEKPPPWTCRDGLLLETRQFKYCDLRSLDAVRGTFDKAAPIGADYVDGVFHGFNPFSLTAAPFLSRYSGYMDLRKPGTYGFMVSSQDCSFLLIDGKLVASAPGMHGPVHRAFRGLRHDVKLAAGPHKFDYYHAAAGPRAMMVAAWEPNPVADKPQYPTTIPTDVFHTHLIGRLPASRLSLRTVKQVPDFVVKLINDVPLPDNDVPLVGVLLRDVSTKALTMRGAKLQWDFGDGQTSDLPIADHVYLRPGLYAVKLSVRRGGKTVETTNRIYVDRPHLSPGEKLYSFDDYLKIIETYDPQKLDAASLRQMALVLEAKALALANQAEDAAKKAKGNFSPLRAPTEGWSGEGTKRQFQDTLSDSERYLAKAVAAGKTAFVDAGDSAAKGDEDLLKLAQLAGPMARDRLGDSETGFQIWHGAAGRIAAAEAKAQCEIAAADIAANDLLKPAEAKSLLESASKRLGKRKTAVGAAVQPVGAAVELPHPAGGGSSTATPTFATPTFGMGPIAAKLERVWGDYYAATGDGKSARQAYLEAERLSGSTRPLIETTATRGAHARSTEEFIKQKQFARAAEELQAWQREFPAEKIEGYLTLLYARYWAGRGKYAQAIAQAEQLQAVSPDSPYIDQVLLVAADSEMRRGRKDRALATLHALLKDYPGSPLAPLAKRNIVALEGGEGRGTEGEGRAE